MIARSYSDVRENLKACMDEVESSRAPLLITRRNGADAVLITQEEWDSMETTLHLLSSRANAQRLFEAIEQAEAGKGIERDLIE